MIRFRMFTDIIERFLRDTIEGNLYIWGQGSITLRAEGDG